MAGCFKVRRVQFRVVSKCWAQVDTRKEIASGSEQEVEIRACTVVAVEQLRDALVAKYGALAAADGRHGGSAAAQSSSSTSQSGEQMRCGTLWRALRLQT